MTFLFLKKKKKEKMNSGSAYYCGEIIAASHLVMKLQCANLVGRRVHGTK